MFVFHVKFGSFCFHNFIPCVLHQLLYDSNYCHLPLSFYISLSPPVPDAAPQNFEFSVVNGTARVEFRWAPPPAASANGVITEYTLTCNSSSSSSSSFPSPDMNISVGSLSPGSRYFCNVTASTSVGTGPPTPLLHVLTGNSFLSHSHFFLYTI